MTQVSFLVPCFNYARYLPDCLDSILSQQGSFDFEVVLVDDASTDQTPEVLARYTDTRIRVIRNATNQGHARTMEIGLAATRGQLVARIDPDDRYRPHFLSKTVPLLEQHPEVGLVYGDAALIDESGQQTAICPSRHHGQPWHGSELVDLLQSNFICAPTVIARRACWLDALPIPKHLAFNDWYFTVQIARKWKFYYLPEVLADYRVHATQHHNRVAADGTEERSVRWLLDQVYASAEADAAIEAAKQRARKRVYGAHALDAAEKFFGAGRYDAARSGYLRALRLSPARVLRPGPLRRLAATFLGRAAYERIKSLLGNS